MRKISEALYKEEIEELLGKLFSGNITCITYELLKDTTDMEALITYLTGEEVSKGEEVREEPSHNSPSFDSWFSTCKEIV